MSKGRDFHKFSPAVWRSKRYLGVSDEARYLWIYLAFNDHQTSAGCYLLPPPYACADLDWPLEQYLLRLQPLIQADMVLYDAETSEILVCRWLQHNAPTNGKHAASIYSHISKIESDALRERAESDFADTSWGEKFLTSPSCAR